MKHTSCILCNATSLKPLENYTSYELVRCNSCDFVFTQKIPDKQELLEYYSENYDRTNYFSPITKKRYNELLDKFEPFRKTNRMLDIGCGYGFFLEVARERGWEVYGVEITDDAVDACTKKGINMFKGDSKDVNFDNESFDVVISIEVIEHLNDPNSYLSKAHDLLRSGGVMYVTTPNFNSYLRYRLKEDYDVISYPNHLCYFTARTLKQAFTQNGFIKKKVITTGMSITRLKTSKGKSQQEFVSETSDDEMLRYRIEKNRGLRVFKSVANFFLNATKSGVSLKGTFVKP
jgi:2-polyprenyl-3-methyl-5-hydroxy-6-metoxy-1,4-benzoquinol methylase